MSDNGRRALGIVIVVAAALIAARAWLPGARLGPPREATACARPVERAGVGVTCDGQEPPGTRVEPDGRHGRMSPARLALFDVPIDLGRAPAEELMSLSGIGPGLAARIVEARAARPFATAGDLSRVKGIGRRRLRQIQKRLYVDGATQRREGEQGM